MEFDFDEERIVQYIPVDTNLMFLIAIMCVLNVESYWSHFSKIVDMNSFLR